MNRNVTSVGQRFFQSDESRIFVIGSSMLILWFTTIAVLWRLQHPMWNPILTMGLAHMSLGRAASIAQATQCDMHSALTVFLALYFDVTALFIVYPILIFSYRNFLERKFFQKHVRPMFDSAKRSLRRMRGFKIAGIFFFVWFPLWMTGIIVGALIGYLLNLRTWVTMSTVIFGTLCAITMWVYAYDMFFGWLGRVHPAVPASVTIVIILILAALRLRSLHKRI